MMIAGWVLLPIAMVLGLLLVRQHRVVGRVRARGDVNARALRVRDDEYRHLIEVRLPAVAESWGEPSGAIPGPVRSSGDPYADVIGLVLEQHRRTRADATQAATATLKAMMRSVQNLAAEQQVAISDAEQRHDDPGVLADLLKIDHTNAQLARRAQAVAVLCGSWPGLQRSASTLTDVVRGATGRIRDFPRVALAAPSDTALQSRVVEPVVLAVAELLDNGARHSQPGTRIDVNFAHAHNGMAIVIDDAGVGMTPDTTQRATWLLSGHGGHDIGHLGDPPRIGFAVVGVLAARYGFSVSVDTRSPYGGVRAVVFLPTVLHTRVSTTTAPAPELAAASPGLPTRIPAPAHGAAVAAPGAHRAGDPNRTARGLPRRQRRTPAPEPSSPSTAAAEPLAPQSPARVAAWARGTRTGRLTSPTPTPTVSERDPQ